MKTAERVTADEMSDNYIFQRNLFAYQKALPLIRGRVLEIGTGSGYGLPLLAAKADELITIDKEKPAIDFTVWKNVSFMQLTAPDFSVFADASFDTILAFQVIEHIENDEEFVREVRRLLKPGGLFLVSTPNRIMSLTRNPWHVREYDFCHLDYLLRINFRLIHRKGIYGNNTVMQYYRVNEKAVKRLLRFDLLGMQHWLPSWMLRIPYDFMNRVNRVRLLQHHAALTQHIKATDFSLKPASDNCLDLFYVAE
jgi:SAM-dependent methyltransferase